MIKSKKMIISLVVSMGLIGMASSEPVHASTASKSVQISTSKSSKTTSSKVKKQEYKSKVKNLSVRSAAKTNAKVLGKLKKNEVVVGLEKMSNGWVKVEYKGKTGYVSNSKGKYLKEGPYVEDRKSADKVISSIKSISKKVTLKDKTKITNARKSYSALNKSAKSLVTNLSTLTKAESALTKLENQKSADNVIAAIKSISKNVTLNDKAKITNARKSYNALNKTAKSLVTNLSTLTKAESALTKLENQKSADNVIAAIKSISKNVTLNDKAKITNARKSYNALNKTAKSLVTNLSTLTKAESTLTKLENELKIEQENQKQAQVISGLIAKINRPITLDDEEMVVKARTEYNKLNSKAKAMVANVDVLLNAEAEIIKLKEMQGYQEEANKVVDLIDSIPSLISLDDKEFIEDVKAAYDKLNSNSKAMVYNIDVLLNAQLEISRLEEEKVNKEMSQGIIDMITNIKDLADINLDDKDSIVKVRTAYNNLNQNAKAMIPQSALSVLEDAESKIAKLEKEKNDIESAQRVEEQINSLNKTLVITDYKTILNIRREFDKLSKEAKLLVTNLSILQNAEAEINVKKERYDKAMNLIGGLPDDITLEHEAQILEARQAFEDLTQDEKDHVLSIKYHYQLLTRAEEALDRLKNII